MRTNEFDTGATPIRLPALRRSPASVRPPLFVLCRAFVCAVLCGCRWWNAAVRADLIVLRDGHEYQGTLVRADEKFVEFRREGKTVRYPRTEVIHVRLQKRREWAGIARAKDIPDRDFQQALKAARGLRPNMWPGAAVVTLLRRTSVHLRNARTWTVRRRSIVRILNEHGESVSVQQIVYRKDADQVRILHGVTVRPDGTVLHLADTAVQDESVYSEYPRYDTVRRRRFALPEGKPGNILDFATEVERRKPLELMDFADEILFGGRDPVLCTEVEVFVPDGTVFRWQVLNDPDGVVRHTAEKKNGGTLHRWVRLRSPQMLPEPLMPPWADVVPRLVMEASTDSWEQAAARFRSVLRRLDQRWPEVPVPPGDTPEKVWETLSRAVKEAPVPLFASGRVPRDPAETWRLRSGSPLDRCYLLYRWLRAVAGDAGRVTWLWVRPRGAGRLANEAPSLGFMAIPAVRLERRGAPALVLRPGDDLDEYREPGFFLGGAPALDENGHCAPLPVPDPEQFGVDRTVVVRLAADGSAWVVDRVTYRGAAARALRAWRRLTSEEIRNRVQARVRAVSGRARRIRWEVEGDVNQNQPSESLVMRYEIPGFADVRTTLCSLQPPWLTYDAGVVGRDTRRFALFWGAPRLDSVSVEITGPPGWRVYASPAPAHFADGPSLLAAEVEAEGGGARCTVRYERRVLDAPASEYPALKRCLEQRAAIGRQYWVWRSRQHAEGPARR